VSPVRCELGFYIPEDGILHSHRRENLKSYIDSWLVIQMDRAVAQAVEAGSHLDGPGSNPCQDMWDLW
jgi:hypothetical protein